MEHQQQIRDHLIGFRVTADEHDLLCRCALADERTITGMLRKMLAETVSGFGSGTQDRTSQRQERAR